jgi:hypothetical protein
MQHVCTAGAASMNVHGAYMYRHRYNSSYRCRSPVLPSWYHRSVVTSLCFFLFSFSTFFFANASKIAAALRLLVYTYTSPLYTMSMDAIVGPIADLFTVASGAVSGAIGAVVGILPPLPLPVQLALQAIVGPTTSEELMKHWVPLAVVTLLPLFSLILTLSSSLCCGRGERKLNRMGSRMIRRVGIAVTVKKAAIRTQLTPPSTSSPCLPPAPLPPSSPCSPLTYH